jgi:hypothetical protein
MTLKAKSLITVFGYPGIIISEHNVNEWVVEYKTSTGLVRARVNKFNVKERTK